MKTARGTDERGPERETCAYHLAHEAEFRALSRGLDEVKGRVHGIETKVERGVLLLVANLVGVVMTLVQQLLRSM